VIYQQVTNEDPLGIPCAIKLERENCTEELTFTASSPVIETWALELEKKINQRNFHKLFKAKKKIGKGAFATVYLAERLRDHQMVAVKAFSK
jgi:calcium-dependent protein kinase